MGQGINMAKIWGPLNSTEDKDWTADERTNKGETAAVV